MYNTASYRFGYDLNDKLEVVEVPKVLVNLKDKPKWTHFTHLDKQYKFVDGVLRLSLRHI